MYRTSQATTAPPDDTERLEIPRYTKLWRTLTLWGGVALLVPQALRSAGVLGPDAGLNYNAGGAALVGAVCVVLAITLLRQKVAVVANYTRAELTIAPPLGAARTVPLESIRAVTTGSVKDSRLTRVTLATADGPVLVVTAMAVDEAVEGIERMLSKAKARADAIAEST